jgi:hypothetical protein
MKQTTPQSGETWHTGASLSKAPGAGGGAGISTSARPRTGVSPRPLELAGRQAPALSCGPCRLRVPERSSPGGPPPALPNGPIASASAASFVTCRGSQRRLLRPPCRANLPREVNPTTEQMHCKCLPHAPKQRRQVQPEKTALQMKKWFTGSAHEQQNRNHPRPGHRAPDPLHPRPICSTTLPC